MKGRMVEKVKKDKEKKKTESKSELRRERSEGRKGAEDIIAGLKMEG